MRKYENKKWYYHKMIEIFPSINGFTPSILDSKKMSQEPLTPTMTLPQESFFYSYIILIIYQYYKNKRKWLIENKLFKSNK